MSEVFPTDRAYAMQEVLKRHERDRPASANKKHGDPVEDISNWQGKYTADPSAGTGEGSHCEPQKKEVI